MDKPEEKQDFSTEAERWTEAIQKAGEAQKSWESRGKKVVERYRDDRHDGDGSKRFNILWSNVETLKPAVYAKTPKPQVSRRYKDADPLGRQAAMILERALEYQIDSYDFDGVVKAAVEDVLLPGRGVAWVRYVPTFTQDENGEEAVAYEEAPTEYVFWQDFRHGPARQWSEVPWVARRAYLGKDKLRRRFPKVADKIPLDHHPESMDEDCADQFKKACIWEIWDKESRQVIWIHEKCDYLLDKQEPPLNLHGFFPCPKPLFANTTNDKLIPVPDYAEYQDQAEELDNLTARINCLVDAVKVSGLYAGELHEIEQLLSGGEENKLIPVENWAMFAERGGLEGAISWFPLDQVVTTIVSLYEAREKTKQELYEITGLSDIIRGSSVAQETATAQRIKGQFATLRLQDKQDDVANFARDLLRLTAEVICEHFDAQTLQLMTGLQVTPEIMALFQDDATRSFRIDVETDSTLQIDEEADKASRVEFLQTASTFLQQAIPAYQQMPQLGPLLGEMLMFGIRGFRAGRELEDAFEQAMAQMGQQPQQGQQPDPKAQAEAAKAQQEMQQSQEKHQADMAETRQDMKHQQEEHVLDMQAAAQTIQQKRARGE